MHLSPRERSPAPCPPLFLQWLPLRRLVQLRQQQRRLLPQHVPVRVLRRRRELAFRVQERQVERIGRGVGLRGCSLHGDNGRSERRRAGDCGCCRSRDGRQLDVRTDVARIGDFGRCRVGSSSAPQRGRRFGRWRRPAWRLGRRVRRSRGRRDTWRTKGKLRRRAGQGAIPRVVARHGRAAWGGGDVHAHPGIEQLAAFARMEGVREVGLRDARLRASAL